MQEGSQVQESVSQNIDQSGSMGNQGSTPAEDIANSYDASELEQEEGQEAQQAEVIGDAERRRQKNQARWDKILNERKQDRELIRQLQEKSQQFDSKEHQSALLLRQLLTQRPQYASLLHRLFTGEDPQQVVNEIFRREQAAEASQQRPDEEEMDPRTAGVVKELEELKRWRQSKEQQEKEYIQEQVGKYQEDINHEYKRRLIEDGYFDQKGQPVDREVAGIFDSAVKAMIQTTAKNPDIPTGQEFDQAYSTVKQCFKSMEEKIRRDMSKKSVSEVPPLSGTSSGQMPIGKAKMTDHDRYLDLADAYLS